jgi:hypothetical protein
MSTKSFLSRVMVSSFVAGLATSFAFAGQPADVVDQKVALGKWIADNANARKFTPEEALNSLPPGPNPMLSIIPEGMPSNASFWQARNQAKLAGANSNRAPANVRLQLKKKTGTVLRAFGTGPSQESAIDLFGSANLPDPSVLMPNAEDEGSIPLSTDTMLTTGEAVRVSGLVGDGPFGSSGAGTGDVDFYAIYNVQEGQVINVNIDTPLPFDDLDPFVALWTADGDLVAFNDDDGSTFDSLLRVAAPIDGTYYVAITGFGTFITDNPFDSSSGLGLGSEGTYDAVIGLDYFSRVDLSFQINKGEIFGASLNTSSGGGTMSLADKQGLERIGSSQNATSIHPAASPLPGNGPVALSHTVDTTGNFSLSVFVPDGDFEIALRTFINPLKQGGSNDVQKVFIDFDGQTIDTGEIFFGIPTGIVVSTLSPLVDFLPGWGLDASDEDAVIDAIMSEIEETLVDDVRRGREPTQEIVLLNSRDHADPGNDPNVSRIVVGGTIPELQIETLGIAQSIDVGNFETSETAVVLLDLLSAPATNPNSLNQFTIAAGSSIIDLIGVGVGNITSHEAGHFLGNWHTDQFNDLPSIQDQGGNLPNFIGLGPDGIFGTQDDIDVDFGRDEFVPSEGFTGIEDTLNSIAIGTPTPRGK